VGIPGNEEADNAVRESLNKNLDKTEEYPLQDLVNWITEQHEEQQQTQWVQTGSEKRNQKPQRTKRNDNHRDGEKRPGSGKPSTDGLFQSNTQNTGLRFDSAGHSTNKGQ
jgi:hypothetical protein